MQGVTIVKPIVFGNVARYFGKKREEDGHTHQWSVYVKPYINEVRDPAYWTRSTHIRDIWLISTHHWKLEMYCTTNNDCSIQDMSAYVKKIQFKLHESYGNPLRGGCTLYLFIGISIEIMLNLNCITMDILLAFVLLYLTMCCFFFFNLLTMQWSQNRHMRSQRQAGESSRSSLRSSSLTLMKDR